MNKYEYTIKTIPKNRRILVSALILLGTLLLAGYTAMDLHLLSGKQDRYSVWSFPVAIFVIGLLLSLYYWRRKEVKEVKELTPEAKAKIKKQEEEFYSRWYIRYLGTIFMLGWAYACYIIYTKGMTLSAIEHKLGAASLKFTLLFNPITGIIATVIAIFSAWEISLIVIVGVVLYYAYLGIAALPVSVAIIIGSIIIAYGIYKYKA